MLTDVKITNFQSAEDVTLTLGPLTVLVGPSSSGKSALLRALRTMARNTSGTSFVTSGKSLATVTAQFEDAVIAIERGKGASTYRAWDAAMTAEQQYPKAGTNVPEDVARTLKMPVIEGQDLNFAFQFDKPFLLDESGSTAAKVIGDLTNVNTLHEASREANRRRLETLARLKSRKADAASLIAQVHERYDDLPHVKGVLRQAEDALAQVRERAEQVAAVRAALDEWEHADAAVAGLARAVTEVPDVAEQVAATEALIASVSDLRLALFNLDRIDEALLAMETAIEAAEEKALVSDLSFIGLLDELGVCPLCESRITREGHK